MYDKNLIKTKIPDLLAYRASDDFNDIKKAMVSGWHPGCHRCRADEMAGKQSRRQVGHSQLSGIDGVIEDVEINLSNECNLTCKMCGPHASTKWQTLLNSNDALNKWYKHHPVEPSMLQDVMARIDISRLNRIKYLGGEPFITKEIVQLFELLDGSSAVENITFSCHTNCTLLPQKHIGQLSRFKRLQIGLSIDGIGDHAEYIRTGFAWTRIDEVVDKWVELARTRAKNGFVDSFYIHTTVQAYNLHHIPKLTRYARSKGLDFGYGFLDGPRRASVSALPHEYKKQVVKDLYLDPMVPKALVEQASLLRSEPELVAKLRSWTDDLDNAMNTSLSSVIPKLAKCLAEC